MIDLLIGNVLLWFNVAICALYVGLGLRYAHDHANPRRWVILLSMVVVAYVGAVYVFVWFQSPGSVYNTTRLLRPAIAGLVSVLIANLLIKR